MSRNLGVVATFLVLATAAAVAAPAPLDLPPGSQAAAKVIEKGAIEGTCALPRRRPAGGACAFAPRGRAGAQLRCQRDGAARPAAGGARRGLGAALRARRHHHERSRDLGVPRPRQRARPAFLGRVHRRFRAPSSGSLRRRRRARVRRLRHPGAGVRVGRLQGRRPQGQDPRRPEQRPGLGPCAVRRASAACTTGGGPTSTRTRRAGGRPRGDHHPHHAVGRLRLEGGSELLVRRAVRAPGGRRGAGQGARWTTEAAARRLVALGRLRPRRADGQAQQPRVQADPARRSAPRWRLPTRSRTARRPTCWACCPGATRCSATRCVVFIGPPRPPRDRQARRDRRRDLQRGARQRHRGRPGARDRQGVHGAAAAPARARSCSLFVAGEESGLLGSAYYAAHPTVPIERSPRTSTSTAATSSGRTARRGARRQGQVHPRHGGGGGGGAAGRGWSPTSRSPTAAPTTAPTSSASPGPACRRSTSRVAWTSSGAPPGLGRRRSRGVGQRALPPAQRRVRPELELRRHDRGRPARASSPALAVAQADAMPTWLPGDEFAKLREAVPVRKPE